MQVKTGELRNHLSHYLKRLAETGEAVTILDRDRPVARIVPMRAKKVHADPAWEKEKAARMTKAKRLGIKLVLPAKRPKLFREIPLLPPSPTETGRRINAVVEMRKEKDY